jgi:hypothetical protein
MDFDAVKKNRDIFSRALPARTTMAVQTQKPCILFSCAGVMRAAENPFDAPSFHDIMKSVGGVHVARAQAIHAS